MTPRDNHELIQDNQAPIKKTNFIISYLTAIWTNLKNKNYLWLFTRLVIPLIAIVAIIFSIANYNLGLSADAAVAKLRRDGIAITDYSAFKYASEGKTDIVSMLTKSGITDKYIIAGAIAGKNISILNSYLNSKSDITQELPQLYAYLSSIKSQSDKLDTNCSSALSLAIQLNNPEIITKLLSDPSYIKNKQDCSVSTAIRLDRTDAINQLKTKGLTLSKSELINLIKDGEVGVVPFITDASYDPEMLSAIENINHAKIELLGEPKHTQIEQKITDAVLKAIPEISKNELLITTLSGDKLTLAAGLIRNGAKNDILFTPKGSDKPTTIQDYIIQAKNDKLASALITSGYNYPTLTTLKDQSGTIIKENTLNYFIINNMFGAAIELVNKNFDLNSAFRPTTTSVNELPIAFSAANIRTGFPILAAMIKKNNVVKTMTPELKQRLVASVFNNLGYSEDKLEDLTILKDLLTQDIDINSTLNQVSYGLDSSNYAELSAPIWGTVYLSKSNGYSILNDKNITYLNEYHKLIGPYIKKFDFTRDGYTSIGMAVLSENIELVKLLLDNKVSANNAINTSSKKPILQQALEGRSDEVAKLLLKSDIKLNEVIKTQNSGETTYLINTIKGTNGSSERIKLLVEAGANVNLCISYNELEQICPLGSALNNNSKSEIVYYLESKGAKCNYVGNGLCKK
jgi:Ankyrin repeats (3 copies)